jgi:hypothetical protein
MNSLDGSFFKPFKTLAVRALLIRYKTLELRSRVLNSTYEVEQYVPV